MNEETLPSLAKGKNDKSGQRIFVEHHQMILSRVEGLPHEETHMHRPQTTFVDQGTQLSIYLLHISLQWLEDSNQALDPSYQHAMAFAGWRWPIFLETTTGQSMHVHEHEGVDLQFSLPGVDGIDMLPDQASEGLYLSD